MSPVGAVYPHVSEWLSHYRQKLGNPRTLEGGAGSGQYAQFFPEECYVSFDIEESWYDQVRKPTVFASSDNLPFEDNSFDFAFVVAAFDYFPNPVKSLEEMKRCLKPGGRLVLFTYDRKTLQRINDGCTQLKDSRAHEGHHVYDKQVLKKYAKKVGLNFRNLPYRPHSPLVEKLKLFLKPTYLRNYEFIKPA